MLDLLYWISEVKIGKLPVDLRRYVRSCGIGFAHAVSYLLDRHSINVSHAKEGTPFISQIKEIKDALNIT